MKFRDIKPFMKGMDVENYLTASLRSDLLELIDGLHRIKLLENLEAFEYEGVIQPSTEQEIRNELSTIPSGRLIIKHSGDPALVDGDTNWNTEFVYLKNAGTNPLTVKVIFFK